VSATSPSGDISIVSNFPLHAPSLLGLQFFGGKVMALTTSFAGRRVAMLLLGIWLILTGLLPLLNVRLSPTFNIVLSVIAIIAGVLLLIDR